MASDFRRRLDAATGGVDSGVGHPVPGTPRWDAQYGRAWAAGLILGGLGFIGGLVGAVAAGPGVGQVRGLAVAVAAFAATFFYGLVYLARHGLGFGWQNGVIWPDEKPVKYALIIGTGSALTIAAMAAAGWAGVHADVVARWMAG